MEMGRLGTERCAPSAATKPHVSVFIALQLGKRPLRNSKEDATLLCGWSTVAAFYLNSASTAGALSPRSSLGRVGGEHQQKEHEGNTTYHFEIQYGLLPWEVLEHSLFECEGVNGKLLMREVKSTTSCQDFQCIFE